MKKEATAKWMYAQGPCERYTLSQIESLWGENEALTPHQIAELANHPTDPISLSDALWGLIQMLNPSERDCFARGEARDVLYFWEIETPEIVRQFLETGDEGLRKEARRIANIIVSAYDANAASAGANAANAAVYASAGANAANDAAYAVCVAAYAACAAAYDASASALTATYNAAYAEEQRAQIERLLEYADPPGGRNGSAR
jgi:hypothetical protein